MWSMINYEDVQRSVKRRGYRHVESIQGRFQIFVTNGIPHNNAKTLVNKIPNLYQNTVSIFGTLPYVAHDDIGRFCPIFSGLFLIPKKVTSRARIPSRLGTDIRGEKLAQHSTEGADQLQVGLSQRNDNKHQP